MLILYFYVTYFKNYVSRMQKIFTMFHVFYIIGQIVDYKVSEIIILKHHEGAFLGKNISERIN